MNTTQNPTKETTMVGSLLKCVMGVPGESFQSSIGLYRVKKETPTLLGIEDAEDNIIYFDKGISQNAWWLFFEMTEGYTYAGDEKEENAVLELTQYADSTKELVELADHIYSLHRSGEITLYNMHHLFYSDFLPIVRHWHKTDYPEANMCKPMTPIQQRNFATIFTHRYHE